MDDRPSEALVEQMMPALGEFAQLIAHGVSPDSEALKVILLKAGLAKDKKALAELERWGQILQRVHDMPDDSDQRAAAIAGLLERGVREAPATLAVERAASQAVPPVAPLIVEPDAVDFGLLRSGESANRTLTVTGRLRDVQPRSNQLSVALHKAGPSRTLVKIMLTPGEPGESLNDELVLRGEGVEVRVPVTARWDVRRKPAVPKDPQNPQPLRVCTTCSERSLFWNWRDKTWECLNPKCPDYYRVKKPEGRR